MTAEELVLYAVEDRYVATITLNRPDKLNALDDAVYEAMLEAFDRALEDDDVKVVILRGAGSSFCTGHDLTQVSSVYKDWVVPPSGEKPKRRPSQRSRLITDRRRMHERWYKIFNFPKVTIAQIHGYCIEGGANIALLCDISIAAEDAVFSYKGQRLAAGGASTLMMHLSNLIGYKRARELILTGRDVSGAEAAKIGLVNQAVPPEDLENTTRSMARRIAGMPRDAIVVGKFYTSLAYDMMGLNGTFNAFSIGHTLATNLRFEEDEYNFHRARRDKGARDAIHDLDEFFDGGKDT
jgi:enoyl-CoA hydratase